MEMISFGKTRDCILHMKVTILKMTPLRYMTCIVDCDLDHDLHKDCRRGIREHMWAQHRDTWGKLLRERRGHDTGLLILSVS